MLSPVLHHVNFPYIFRNDLKQVQQNTTLVVQINQ